MARECREHNFFAGSRKYGAADGDDQGLRAPWNPRSNFLDRPAQLRQSQIAVLLGGRADANQDDVGVRDSIRRS